MNPSSALHTAARRYCLERHGYWCDQYAEIVHKRLDRQPDGYHYTSEALATFPRYNLLNAIRVEVERLDAAKLGDVDNTRELLVLAGQIAEDAFTRQPLGEIEAQVITMEREAFCSYVAGLTATDLNAVESLPYRRVLATDEAGSLWLRLRNRWRIPNNSWYPLAECELPDVVAFNASAFDKAMPFERLREVLSACGIERVWELWEYGPEYEEELALFEPSYNGAEGYWSSGDLDWIMYASHENSVTVGGWLVSELKTLWPSWQTHVWTGDFG